MKAWRSVAMSLSLCANSISWRLSIETFCCEEVLASVRLFQRRQNYRRTV